MDNPATDDDKLREECGVVAVFGVDEAALHAALGLHELQHRGEEACGVVSLDSAGVMHTRLRMGHVGEHFGDAKAGKLRQRLPGYAALGHTRYSTAGGSTEANIQPFVMRLSCGTVALGHNGNLTNANILEEQLTESGSIFRSTSDSEVILQLMARPGGNGVVSRFVDALKQIEGGYALAGLGADEKVLFAARDPNGIRPLVMGWLPHAKGEALVLASETCAIEEMGARVERAVLPGEVIEARMNNFGEVALKSTFPLPPAPYRPDVFEFIYFARPDSVFDGISISQARQRMGHELARENPQLTSAVLPNAVVVPVLDSGLDSALGFVAASGIPQAPGLLRSHYAGRSFIQPSQDGRDQMVSRKHRVNRAEVMGKEVVLVDDSLVRGTTMGRLVREMYAKGATAVHVLIACPPILHGDYYGIDMPDEDRLFAVRHNGDVAAMCDELGATSLTYLSIDGLYRAILGHARNPAAPQLADHVLTGDYPTRLADRAAGMMGPG